MIYAQIKNGLIQNTVILNDVLLLDLFQNNPVTNEPYDCVLQIDMLYPRPGIGWIFDGISFIAPPILDDIQEFLDGSVSLLFSKSALLITAGTYLSSGSVASNNAGQSVLGHSNIIAISVTNANTVTSQPMVYQLQQRVGLNSFTDIPDANISIPIGSYSSFESFFPYIEIDGTAEISAYFKSGNLPSNPILQVHLI